MKYRIETMIVIIYFVSVVVAGCCMQSSRESTVSVSTSLSFVGQVIDRWGETR